MSYTLFAEDCDIRTSELYRAILVGMHELSEDRAILLELVTQLLEWRKAQVEQKKERESGPCKVIINNKAFRRSSKLTLQQALSRVHLLLCASRVAS
mgnify:CR=1 FL=1